MIYTLSMHDSPLLQIIRASFDHTKKGILFIKIPSGAMRKVLARAGTNTSFLVSGVDDSIPTYLLQR